jgi:hypothetical protein
VLAAILYSAVDWRGQLVCTLLLLGHLGLLLHCHTQLAGCLMWRTGGWLWTDYRGAECVLELQSAALWPGLIVLRFRVAATGKIRIFTLLHDSFAADMQRRLRVYLRHMPVFADSG